MTDPTMNAAIIAQASGEKKGRERWTVLSIYAFANERMAVDQGFIGGRFVAEIVGETAVKGEERRVRRAAFATLAKALSWTHFDAKTQLFAELRDKAIAWMETQARDVVAGGDGSGLVPIPCMGTAGASERPTREPKQYAKVEVDLRFAGGREAIAEPHTVSVTWFNADGSVGARTSGHFNRSFNGATIRCELPENSR